MKLHPVILPLSPEDRRLRGRAGVQARSRRAREALALSCEASGVSLGPLTIDAHGAPIPFNNTYWSLSHKSRFVTAVVGPSPVGIDIEEVRPRNEELYGYVAGADEWALADRSWTTFFLYWTAKEAVLKAVGVGIAHLKKARIHAILSQDYLLVDYDSELWPVKHFRFQDHIVALMHDDHEVVWDLR
jgi:4'-phosphopantetheinyl transferase